jgi:hypothetical protein
MIKRSFKIEFENEGSIIALDYLIDENFTRIDFDGFNLTFEKKDFYLLAKEFIKIHEEETLQEPSKIEEAILEVAPEPENSALKEFKEIVSEVYEKQTDELPDLTYMRSSTKRRFIIFTEKCFIHFWNDNKEEISKTKFFSISAFWRYLMENASREFKNSFKIGDNNLKCFIDGTRYYRADVKHILKSQWIKKHELDNYGVTVA